VSDNGKGFDVKETINKSAENNSMGLQGMIERVGLVNGKIEIISSKGQSTKNKIWLPVDI